MNKEQFKKLWRTDELEEVDEEIDDSWRHGNYVSTVYEYKGQYWRADYQVSGDGEYHGIREDDFELTRVFPETKVVVTTEYTTKVPSPKSNTAFRRKVYQVEACRFPGVPKIDLNDISGLSNSMDELEKFMDWAEVNSGKTIVTLRGENLVLARGDHTIIIPPGLWIVKEVGNEIYHMTDEQFRETFEPL